MTELDQVAQAFDTGSGASCGDGFGGALGMNRINGSQY